MSDQIINSSNLCPELIKSVLDDAYMDASLDDDGDVVVRENGVNIWIRADKNNKDRIRFFSLFRFVSDSPMLARLNCVNQINNEYIILRASVKEDRLFLDYDLMLLGEGITKKTLVLNLKRYAGIPRSAVSEYGDGVIQ
jgi:hypothetical protein